MNKLLNHGRHSKTSSGGEQPVDQLPFEALYGVEVMDAVPGYGVIEDDSANRADFNDGYGPYINNQLRVSGAVPFNFQMEITAVFNSGYASDSDLRNNLTAVISDFDGNIPSTTVNCTSVGTDGGLQYCSFSSANFNITDANTWLVIYINYGNQEVMTAECIMG